LFKNRLNLKILKSKIIEKNNIPIDYICPLHGTNLSSCYESIFSHEYDGDPEMLKGKTCFMKNVMNYVIHTRRNPTYFPKFDKHIKSNLRNIALYMDSRHIASIIKTYKLSSPEPLTRAIAGIVQLFSIYDKMISSFCPASLSKPDKTSKVYKTYEDYVIGGDNLIRFEFVSNGGFKDMIKTDETLNILWLSIFTAECYREGSLWHFLIKHSEKSMEGENVQKLISDFHIFTKQIV
jgi:hypothetical protein